MDNILHCSTFNKRKKVTIVMNPVSYEMSTGKGENTSRVS